MGEILYNAEWIDTTIQKFADQATLFADGEKNIAIVGVRTRGVFLAHRVASLLEQNGFNVECGEVDVTLYRDDIAEGGGRKAIQASDISFDLNGRNVVLVDDVIYTGRTIRAAMDELIDFGRPACIKLFCLLDRGGRELPIQPDFMGDKVPMSDSGNRLSLKLKETDGFDEVVKQVQNA